MFLVERFEKVALALALELVSYCEILRHCLKA